MHVQTYRQDESQSMCTYTHINDHIVRSLMLTHDAKWSRRCSKYTAGDSRLKTENELRIAAAAAEDYLSYATLGCDDVTESVLL